MKMLQHLLPLFPDHITYVEPFLGSGTVLMNKPRSKNEIVGDISGLICNFFRCMRDHPDELIRQIELTPYSENEYRKFLDMFRRKADINKADIEMARLFFLGAQGSFSGNLGSGFRMTKGRHNYANRYENKKPQLGAVADRFQRVDILCRDGLFLIKRYNSPDVFMYIDPPYVNTEGYESEFNQSHFDEMIDFLKSEYKGKFILSHYENSAVESLPSYWSKIRVSTKCSIATGAPVSKGKKKNLDRTELIVANFDINQRQLI